MLSFIFRKTQKQTLSFFLVALIAFYLGVFLAPINVANADEQPGGAIVVGSNTENSDSDILCAPHQCSDGIDNDGDGATDYNSNIHLSDPGCSNSQDDDESNPMPPTMYLPQMPICDGSFGTITSSPSTFSYGFHYDEIPEHYVGVFPATSTFSGNHLDWYWVWISSPGHIEWDLGGLTNGVRVYPSQDHGPYPEEFDEYEVKVSSNGSNWFVVASSTTYVDAITNVRVHDGVKDYSTTTSFRYVRISPVSLGGGDYEIDAIQGCSVPPPPPLPPPPQCSDGIDNDGDGAIDMQDSGCANSEDNDENTPPVITLLGSNPMQLTIGTTFIDPGATSTDQEDGDLTSHIVATSTVNVSTASTYTVTYTVVDSKGASSQAVRTVIVVSSSSGGGGGGGGGGGNSPKPCKDALDNDHDGFIDSADPACHTDGNPNNPNSYSEYLPDENSKPIISVIGNNPFEIFLGSAFTDPGATSTDQEDGDLTSRIATTSNVNISAIGTYKVAYSVTDSQTATAQATRTVLVKPIVSGGGSATSTETEEKETIQCPYLLEYLKMGRENNVVEVKKLQFFLRNFEGFSNLAITGIFDQATFDAVSKFQEKYKVDVLEPWGIDSFTGYVYITTKNKVNEIYCQRELPLTDEQNKEIESFRNLLGTIRRQAGTTTPESEIKKMLPEVGQTVATSTFAAGVNLPELQLTTEAEEKGLIGRMVNSAAIFFAVQGKKLLYAIILIFAAFAAFMAGVLWQKIKIKKEKRRMELFPFSS